MTMTLITAADLAARLGGPDVLVFDVRHDLADHAAGRRAYEAGHIPGATNRFFKDNLLPDGRFKPAETLRAEFLALLDGRDPAAIVHQCGSGITACHNLLSMEIAGLGGSRLYPGSWSEWCSDPSRPVAKGA